MKKKIFSLLTALAVILTLAGCGQAEEPVETPTPVVKPELVKPEVIKLDVEVTPDMDFFEDGYEIVTVHQLLDGDTTKYQLKNKEYSEHKDGVYSTRYLAIDTPETSNGLDPWGMAAKKFLNDKLSNAKQIVLMRDPVLTSNVPGEENATFDKYGRILAHVFVDGELVQWHLVNESLAWVKYLYFDYKYNNELLQLETYVKKHDNRRIHNEEDLDPNYDYGTETKELKLAEVTPALIGKNVILDATVTGMQGYNLFIQDEGEGLYVYTKNRRYQDVEVGTRIKLEGSVDIYNGQLQISNLAHKPEVLSQDNVIEPKLITVADMNASNESIFVRMNDITINSAEENINKFYATDKDGNELVVFVPGEAKKNIVKTDVEVGKTYDIIANLGVHKDEYQLVLTDKANLIVK